MLLECEFCTKQSWQCLFILLTCLRHWNLQNIWIRILQIFCYDFFCFIKSRANHSGITQPFLNPNQIFFSNAPQNVCRRIIKKNQNKDFENLNSNILEVPMSWTSYSFLFMFLLFFLFYNTLLTWHSTKCLLWQSTRILLRLHPTLN